MFDTDAERIMQSAFQVYAQSVDATERLTQHRPLTGFEVERWQAKADMDALFTKVGQLARTAASIDPAIY